MAHRPAEYDSQQEIERDPNRPKSQWLFHPSLLGKRTIQKEKSSAISRKRFDLAITNSASISRRACAYPRRGRPSYRISDPPHPEFKLAKILRMSRKACESLIEISIISKHFLMNRVNDNKHRLEFITVGLLRLQFLLINTFLIWLGERSNAGLFTHDSIIDAIQHEFFLDPSTILWTKIVTVLCLWSYDITR